MQRISYTGTLELLYTFCMRESSVFNYYGTLICLLVHIGQDVLAQNLWVGLMGHQIHCPFDQLFGKNGGQVEVQV